MPKKKSLLQPYSLVTPIILFGEEESLDIISEGIPSSEAIGTPHISETSSYGYEFGRRTETGPKYWVPFGPLVISAAGIPAKEKIGKSVIGIDIVVKGIRSRRTVKAPIISLDLSVRGIKSKSKFGRIEISSKIKSVGIASGIEIGNARLSFGISVPGIVPGEEFGIGFPLDAEIQAGRKRIQNYEDHEMITFLLAA